MEISGFIKEQLAFRFLIVINITIKTVKEIEFIFLQYVVSFPRKLFFELQITVDIFAYFRIRNTFFLYDDCPKKSYTYETSYSSCIKTYISSSFRFENWYSVSYAYLVRRRNQKTCRFIEES